MYLGIAFSLLSSLCMSSTSTPYHIHIDSRQTLKCRNWMQRKRNKRNNFVDDKNREIIWYWYTGASYRLCGLNHFSVMKDPETKHPIPKLKAKDRNVIMEYVSAIITIIKWTCMRDWKLIYWTKRSFGIKRWFYAMEITVKIKIFDIFSLFACDNIFFLLSFAQCAFFPIPNILVIYGWKAEHKT